MMSHYMQLYFCRTLHRLKNNIGLVSDSILYISIFLLLASFFLVFATVKMAYAQNANLISNQNFVQSNDSIVGWNDPLKSCQTTFFCLVNATTGWNDNTSLQLSNDRTNKGIWSSIYGDQISVRPGDSYNFTTHMKLNKFATASHVVLEGFNETSKGWSQIVQCPAGTNGPIKWQMFSCKVKIPAGITKIRPVLNAGWSSENGKEATTWFDMLSITKTSS
jgi:hypothetical protein